MVNDFASSRTETAEAGSAPAPAQVASDYSTRSSVTAEEPASQESPHWVKVSDGVYGASPIGGKWPIMTIHMEGYGDQAHVMLVLIDPTDQGCMQNGNPASYMRGPTGTYLIKGTAIRFQDACVYGKDVKTPLGELDRGPIFTELLDEASFIEITTPAGTILKYPTSDFKKYEDQIILDRN